MTTKGVDVKRDRSPRRGDHATPGGAIAAVESLGAAAGAEILRGGGNAADAAIACAFVQCVVDQMRCSIAGSAEILYHDAATGTQIFIDAGGHAPLRATPTMYKPVKRWENAFIVEDGLNRWGYRAQVVPGFLRGMERLYERFSSRVFSWRELLEPAISLAEGGYSVFPHLFAFWRQGQPIGNELSGDGSRALSYSEDAARIFLKGNGEAYGIGETFVQADLARTLGILADEGVETFYRGEIARRIAADFAEHDGLLSYEDLESYEVLEQEPLRFSYRDIEFVTQTAPSVGPAVAQLLQVLDGWDIASLGWNSAEYLDRLAGAMYHVFHDRDEVMADPLVVDVPLELFTSRERAAEIRRLVELGAVAHAEDSSFTAAGLGETTHCAVIDGDGNSCGITHSIGSGTGLITPGLGFMHNNHMTTFDPRPGNPNSIAPGKRGTGGGAPVMGFRDGCVVLSLGSPAGAFKASAMVQVIADILDFGLSLSEAVAADRIHVRSAPPTVLIERLFDPRVAVALGERGHRVVAEEYGARVAAVARDLTMAGFEAASDPRGDRGAFVVSPHLTTEDERQEVST